MNSTDLAVTLLAAESSSGTNYLPLLLIAGLFLLTYFMIIRPQSKRRRAMVEMQSSLAAGVEVVTIGGLYGTVIGTDAETVDLQIAPNVNVTYARGAISKVISPTQEPADADDVVAEQDDITSNDTVEGKVSGDDTDTTYTANTKKS